MTPAAGVDARLGTRPPCKRQVDARDGAAAAAITVVRTLGLPIPDRRVRALFRAHASPSSLLALVEVLPRLGLDVRAIRGARAHLGALPLPMIAHVKRNAEDAFTVVQEVRAEDVLLADPDEGLVRVGLEDFWTRATGVFVVCRPGGGGEGGGAVPSRGRFALEQALAWLDERAHVLLPVAGLAALALIGLAGARAASAETPAWQSAGLAALALVGLGVSVGLAETVLDGSARGGGLLRHLCAQAGPFDCSAVLDSPHGKLAGRLPYAFVSVGFYAAIFALVLVGDFVPGAARAAAVVSALLFAASLAFAVRLLHVQARVIRAWCLGCLSCHGLNVLGAALSVAAVAAVDPAVGGAAPPVGECALLAGLVATVAAMPVLCYVVRAARSGAARAEAQLLALTRNPEVLRAVVAGTPPSPVNSAGEEWGVGPTAASVRLVLFSQPFCPHCPAADRAARAAVGRSAGVRLMVRLLTVDPPAVCPDFLGADRPIAATEMSALLYALGVARGPAAFHAALERVLAAQDEFRRLRPASVVLRLGAARAEVEGALAAGYARLLADARVAQRCQVRHTPQWFVNGRAVPPWAAPDQAAGLADEIARAAGATWVPAA